MSKKEKDKKKVTILFVDDEQFVLDGFLRLLSDFIDVWHMEFAINGREALEIVNEQDIDLIITDQRMPEMPGLELLAQLQADKKTRNIPVVILTGFQDRTLKRQALDLGAIDLINKPVNKEDLVSRINNALKRTHLEAETHRYKNLVTQQAEMIEVLEQKNAQLSKIQDSKAAKNEIDKYRAICGEVAHSLKGEFLNIGFANKQIRELGTRLPDIQEECDIIDRSMAFSRVRLQKLLDYLDIGKPKIEPIDTRELVKKTELLARSRILSNINFQITIAPNIKNPIVSGNIEQFMSVLLELINNANNALRQKGGTIELKLEQKDGEIVISLRDNGPGISAKIRKQLLTQEVPSQSGLGLGLFLSNKVVRELGGKLILKSSSNKGTTFLLLLPKNNDKKEG